MWPKIIETFNFCNHLNLPGADNESFHPPRKCTRISAGKQDRLVVGILNKTKPLPGSTVIKYVIVLVN